MKRQRQRTRQRQRQRQRRAVAPTRAALRCLQNGGGVRHGSHGVRRRPGGDDDAAREARVRALRRRAGPNATYRNNNVIIA
eukprot:9469957-Pyramimonas_sp.AAC.1